jgi:chromosome segregation ATPase
MSTLVPETVVALRSPSSYVPDPTLPLEALRGDLDRRLAALDAALADPARGGSLQGLILDLARVATDGAKAAAARACASTKLNADMQVAQAHAAAQSAVERERTIAASLRGTLEQVQQEITELEREKQAEAQAVRESFERELTERGLATAKIERAATVLQQETTSLCHDLAQSRGELESERARSAELHAALGRGQEQQASRERNVAEANLSLDALRADLALERRAVADLQRAKAQTQADLAAERAAATAVRASHQRAEDTSAALVALSERARAAHAAENADVAGAQQRIADLTHALADTDAQLQAERLTGAELRQTIELADAARQAASLEQHVEAPIEGDSSTRPRPPGGTSWISSARSWTFKRSSNRAEPSGVAAVTEGGSDLVGRLMRDQMDAVAARGVVETDLANSERRVAELQQTLADIESQRSVEQQTSQERTAVLERAFDEMQSRLEAEQKETARLRSAGEPAKVELSQMLRERVVDEAKLEEMRRDRLTARARADALEMDPPPLSRRFTTEASAAG